MNNIENIYNQLLKKYKNSKRIFITLNVVALLLAATVIVLNIFAIRFNPVKTHHDDLVTAATAFAKSHGTDVVPVHYASDGKLIMWLFIALAIMSACVGFLTAFMSFFVWRKRAKKDNEKIQAIKEEVALHKAKKSSYQDADRDKRLIEKITKIRNS